MKGINVLSLFDGISCGQQALKELGIPVAKYYASEIHLPSIRVTQRNHPNTIQLGDVRYIHKYIKKLKIDLILAGSPCQDFSFANKKQMGLDGKKSSLFYIFLEIFKICKQINPNIFFLLENVRMQPKWKKEIDRLMKVDGIEINSKLFGVQCRPRIYWTNIKYELLPNKPFPKFLNSVLEKPFVNKLPEGSFLLTNRKGFRENKRVFTGNDKARTLTSNNRSLIIATTFKTARRATPLEFERVQGLPDNYTSNVCKTDRISIIGYGWHVPTVKHILKGLK